MGCIDCKYYNWKICWCYRYKEEKSYWESCPSFNRFAHNDKCWEDK